MLLLGQSSLPPERLNFAAYLRVSTSFLQLREPLRSATVEPLVQDLDRVACASISAFHKTLHILRHQYVKSEAFSHEF
jgi:hypothetical protein